MTEPKRWIEDEDASPELRSLLRETPRAHAIDDDNRARVGRHLAKLSLVQISIATVLGVKTAAAIGVGVGLATVSLGVVVVDSLKPGEDLPAPRSAVSARARHGVPKRPVEPLVVPSPPPIPSASSEPERGLDPTRAQRGTAPPTVAPPAASTLGEESRWLERARRALGSAPERALALSREHRARFPRAQLASERDLIELEALQRLGRFAEARALGRRLLAQRGDDLYRARIRALMDKMASEGE